MLNICGGTTYFCSSYSWMMLNLSFQQSPANKPLGIPWLQDCCIHASQLSCILVMPPLMPCWSTCPDSCPDWVKTVLRLDFGVGPWWFFHSYIYCACILYYIYMIYICAGFETMCIHMCIYIYIYPTHLYTFWQPKIDRRYHPGRGRVADSTRSIGREAPESARG